MHVSSCDCAADDVMAGRCDDEARIDRPRLVGELKLRVERSESMFFEAVAAADAMVYLSESSSAGSVRCMGAVTGCGWVPVCPFVSQ